MKERAEKCCEMDHLVSHLDEIWCPARGKSQENSGFFFPTRAQRVKLIKCSASKEFSFSLDHPVS